MTDPASESAKHNICGDMSRRPVVGLTGKANTIAAPMHVDAPAIDDRYSGVQSVTVS
eukprot:CAMPEP_0178562554 /NCGR_PEP_ID=MMETSP0697-20121206/12591_1 /TAXON_ID=265572 /ORGANISM="Extubocellulus spinifer, Strain CCMP396" /LENGTH=56 /DNA_ID=CAMNT_0020195903 /DNA_START=5 /DNA_END=175 /DNA_ORIENTATION=+